MIPTHFTSWLAGLLEGEGYFGKGYKSRPKQAAISVEMTDEDIIKKVADAWGVTYAACRVRQDHHKQTFKTQIRGKGALAVMKEVYPFMSQRRQQRIDEILTHCS